VNEALDVAYYIHHHGVGHLTRFQAISAASSDRLHPVTELDTDLGTTGLRLPPDARPGADTRDPTAHGALDWAPLAPDSLAPRLARLAQWLEELGPNGAVVDGSVEVGLACRLAGLPTLVMRQTGERADDAHHLVQHIAERLIAPWPAELEDPSTPTWIVDKTDHVGFVVGSPSAGSGDSPPEPTADPDDVVVLWGSGNGSVPLDALRSLTTLPRRGTVHLVGHCFEGLDVSPGVHSLGWVDDLDALLQARPAVVTSGSNNAVTTVASRGCPLVVVPPALTADEQIAHARRLDDLGAAVVVDDPDDADWAHTLDVARARAERLREVAGGDGARRAAEVIHHRLA
jgi:predicted glycosyltransferase